MISMIISWIKPIRDIEESDTVAAGNPYVHVFKNVMSSKSRLVATKCWMLSSEKGKACKHDSFYIQHARQAGTPACTHSNGLCILNRVSKAPPTHDIHYNHLAKVLFPL